MFRGKKHPIKSIIGNIYGRLKVIDFKGINHKSVSRWLCLCECGKEVIATKDNLHKKGKRSCGCLTTDSFDKRKGCKDMSGGYWNQIKHRNHGRNSNFKLEITPEYAYSIFEKQNKKCALSGLDICFVRDYRTNYRNQTASLDRIDSKGNYTECNIQWVHKDINLMKYNYTQNEFIDFCKLVSNTKKGTKFQVNRKYDSKKSKLKIRRIKSYEGFEDVSGAYWSTTRIRANNANLEFNISCENIWNQYKKQNKKCYFSGIKIHFEPTSEGRNNQTASIDRLDNNKGYTIDNIVIVHKKINFMKLELEENKFIEYCYLIGKTNENTTN